MIGSLLNPGVLFHTAVTLDNFVYIFGNYSKTEFLRAGHTSWEQGPKIPQKMAVGSCAVASSGKDILLIQGQDILEFDTSVSGPSSKWGWRDWGLWPKIKTGKGRMTWNGCTKMGDKVVLVGRTTITVWGDLIYPLISHFSFQSANWNSIDPFSTSGVEVCTTMILDIESRTISKGGGMKRPREYFHIISFNNNGYLKLLGLGGEEDAVCKNAVCKDRMSSVEQWDPDTETWSLLETELKYKRAYFGLVAAPKSIVCPSE